MLNAPKYWHTILETFFFLALQTISPSRLSQSVVEHYNDWSSYMALFIFLLNTPPSVTSWAKFGDCVSPALGRHFLDSSQSVTPKRGRDSICDEKLSAAALLRLPTYFGSAVSRATASSCWLQYKSSRNKRTVPGGEIYCESPLSIILGNSEKDKVELIPSW